jgi:hypothetical protein
MSEARAGPQWGRATIERGTRVSKARKWAIKRGTCKSLMGMRAIERGTRANEAGPGRDIAYRLPADSSLAWYRDSVRDGCDAQTLVKNVR